MVSHYTGFTYNDFLKKDCFLIRLIIKGEQKVEEIGWKWERRIKGKKEK